MNSTDRVAVCSRSFSKNAVLRAKLLERYAQVTFNDAGSQLSGSGLIAFLSGHSKAITALEPIDDKVLSSLPELAVIAKYGVGLDMIDLDAMRRHGKRLGWTAGVNKRSVAELAIALAVSLLREVPASNREVLAGVWRQRVGRQLSGATVGIVGCGNIGKEVVRLLEPFSCRLLAHDIAPDREFYEKYSIESVVLPELLERADVVSLHLPRDASTRGMFSAEVLSLMKPTAVLINTARGGLVDEAALKRMLSEGRISAAAFDVFAEEPPRDAGLLNLPNFLATSHIGGSSAEAVISMGMAAIEGLDANAIP